MMTTQTVYDVDEAAILLHCKASAVRDYIARGILRATKPSKRWLIQHDDLMAFLDSGENVSRTSEPRRARRRRRAA